MSNNGKTLDSISLSINKRMSQYNDSRQPTDDEVTIAWLVCELYQERDRNAILLQKLNKEHNE